MKSSRNQLQQLARVRLRDAKALLDAAHYDGAYYFAGLAVECALKACIAKLTRRYDFPDLTVVRDSWNHDLTKLLNTAGLKPFLDDEARHNRALGQNWSLVKDWRIDDRYKLDRSRAEARDLYLAVTARRSGVLKWIRQHW